ncbi:hypothetical protein PVAG01_03800 [Phlyctema vagabunda]|uniref:Uncharacterized protein n=1 Tax=Phlyctema vagabunda TaxID=108571 RepID=A0ABR4PME8_9HELO
MKYETGTKDSESSSDRRSSHTSDESELLEESVYHSRERRSWWARRSSFWKFVIICIGFVAFDFCVRATIFFAHKIFSPHYSSNGSISNVKKFKTRIGDCYCGHSIAEAKSLGCSYDALAIAWTPPECTDQELTDDFNHAGPGLDGSWIYFADRNGTLPLTAYEVSMMADTNEFFYTSHEWHLVHCNYTWRKLFRSQMNGVIMDREKLSLEHISHCGMLEGPKYHHLKLDTIATQLRNSLLQGFEGDGLKPVN